MTHYALLESASVSLKSWHPQEDYFAVSEKFPIFVLADGVTLEMNESGEYPNPSGAGAVARIFCEEFVRATEEAYGNLTAETTPKLFSIANQAIDEFNSQQGRTKQTINYWDIDIFAATAAFVIIKDTVVYWGSICDAYVYHLNQQREIMFRSPECWPERRKYLPSDYPIDNPRARRIILRRDFRNALSQSGEKIGYGVVTGETKALDYLNHGSFIVSAGERVALCTDGFEPYFSRSEFLNLLSDWPTDFEPQIKKLTRGYIEQNSEQYGHERTLIVVKF